ncbi:glycosyltransferase family 32 protein [Karstenula rhodostoma CBS 690.94]|uniref:Glycosyltransferase family 32 protein n=1 Tax=Karstenula rhodostoma CBS 690.94 TaxID=1392251 RepID=A0A9P4PBJ2_9PLEO|nr:glycosyltransferase family 32 protein [Karstenula rhodostoma CBS 690.94]
MNSPKLFSKWSLVAFAAALSFCLVLFRPTSIPERYDRYIPHLPSGGRTAGIPNIVHYTYLKKDASSTLHFTFQDYLSVYGANTLFKPTAIYLHTDHNDTYIATAAREGNTWTRAILSDFAPILRINHVVAPTTANNLTIKNIEAKSDFVRWEQMLALGGIYMDWDVLPLRDVAALRRVGFRNVVGRQPGGGVNSGLAMCAKGSQLAYLMARDGPRVFDGGWGTHAVDLITHLSDRLVGVDGEVLILDEKAWAPTSWVPDSFDKLFRPHDDALPFGEEDVHADKEQDAVVRWDAKENFGKKNASEWRMDFSPTYLLHAFKSRKHDDDGWYKEWKGVTVEYVMRRNSNFARAAYPLVKRMVEEGLVKETNDEI